MSTTENTPRTPTDQLTDMLAALALEETGPDTFRAPHVELGGRVAFGGELIAQAMVAAERTHPGKRVRTVHTLFTRAVRLDRPSEIRLDRMHSGRNLASATVSVVQEERICARSMVLLDVPEPDLVRHGHPMPVVMPPDPAKARPHPLGGPETIVVGDVDLDDPDLAGPPTLQLWVRFRGAPADPAVTRQLLAFASDGWLIATAMRPHRGIGQSMSHRDFSTSVVSHSLSFTDDFRPDQWLLLDHESVHTGNGRALGRAQVYTVDGQLVAGFSQDALLRAWPDAGPSSGAC